MPTILLFLAYTAFCYWIVFMDGAEAIEGWRAFFLIDWFASLLTPSQLRFYVGISWLVCVVATVLGYR